MNRLPHFTDVFVIGGGPAGLAAAIAARQRGFDVTLADAAIPPIDKACGEGIMPDGIAAARALGIDLEIAHAHPFRGIRFCESGVSAEADFPHGYGIGMRRTTLHRLMVSRAAEAGVRLAWGMRITGITNDGVDADGSFVSARWIVGADGGLSRVRKWAKLDDCRRDRHRFGFRSHYQVAPWSDFMELHWSDIGQLYITPVDAREVCVVLITANSQLRLSEALPHFPEAVCRLRAAGPPMFERGGISASRRLRRVCTDRVALVGDASGGVDAITGEGLCLLFQHATALAGAMHAGDLRIYEAAHRQRARRPELMAALLLLLDGHRHLRRPVMRAMAWHPPLFRWLLAAHVGA